MLVLQNNVFIVAGAKRYCIYDLNTKKLYSLDSEDFRQISRILEGDQDISEEVLNYLLKSGLVVDNKDLIPPLSPTTVNCTDFAWIEITQNCNLICRHCYEESSRAQKMPEMSFSDFQHVVNELQSVGVNRIQLVGGEPLLHSHIEQLIEYVRGKFSFIEVYTNGTLLNDRFLDFAKDNGVALAFSVYSEDASLHDSVTRTEGSFKQTYSHIKQAVSKGIQVRVSSVEMDGLPCFQFSDLEVPHKTDLPRLTGRADLSLYNRDMLRRKLITKSTFTAPIDPEAFFNNQTVHNCFGDHLYIDYRLNVFPCAMERRYCYGTLESAGLSEILGNSLANLTKDRIKGCCNCEFRYACYDCRADANNAELYDKPWYCTYDQENGIWLDEDLFIDSLLAEHNLPSVE